MLVGEGCRSSTPPFIQQHPSYALWGPGPEVMGARCGAPPQPIPCVCLGLKDKVGCLPGGLFFVTHTMGTHWTSVGSTGRATSSLSPCYSLACFLSPTPLMIPTCTPETFVDFGPGGGPSMC